MKKSASGSPTHPFHTTSRPADRRVLRLNREVLRHMVVGAGPTGTGGTGGTGGGITSTSWDPTCTLPPAP